MTSRVLAGLALLLFGLPGALAQPPERPVGSLTATLIEDPIQPETSVGQSTLVVSFSCSQQEMLGPTTPIQVLFEATAPANSVATLSPTSISLAPAEPGQCTDGALQHSASSKVQLLVTSQMGAFQPQALAVKATLTHARATGEQDTWGPFLAEVAFSADYTPSLDVKPSTTRLVAPAADVRVSFPVLVTHRSNGPSVLTVTAFPMRGITVDPIAPIELETGTPTPVERQVDLVARVPADIFEPGTNYYMSAEFSLASKHPAGRLVEAAALSFVVRADGEASRVPLSLLDALVAVVLALGMVAARRRSS